MIAPMQLQKPDNWQDFESLCKKLWGEIWECSDSIKKHGRKGQAQHGVDVYGIPRGETMYYGIQCKGKDDYTRSKLTQEEVDEEIEKAKSFRPALKKLIFATSANKDAVIEEYIRVKNSENIQNGLFEIDVFSWEDIVDLISENKTTKDWYVHNIQYKFSSEVSVTFENNETYEVHPVYVKEIVKYEFQPKPSMEDLSVSNPFLEQCLKRMIEADNLTRHLHTMPYGLHQRTYRKDYTWCDLYVVVQNTGDIAIDDYKLYIQFDPDHTIDIDDCMRFINDPLISDRVHINNQRLNDQEVFESEDYPSTIEYVPKNRTLVPLDRKRFKIRVKPKQGVDEIKVTWLVVSREYHKYGNLQIIVKPTFEDKITIVNVDTEEQLKETEEKIYPKIVEE